MIGCRDLNSLDGQIKTGTVDLYNTSRAVEPIDRLISTGAPYTWPADLVPTTTNVTPLSWNRHWVNFRLEFTYGYFAKPDTDDTVAGPINRHLFFCYFLDKCFLDKSFWNFDEVSVKLLSVNLTSYFIYKKCFMKQRNYMINTLP